MKTKTSAQLTLHDRLSRLTTQQAEKWLGLDGKRLLVEVGKDPLEIDPADVSWPDEATLQVLLRPAGREVVVTQARAAAGRDGVASPSPQARAARCSRTKWASARPSKASASRNSSRKMRVSHGCPSSARGR